MQTRFPKISYATLSARQKENYNYQKVSAVLADYGFATIRLSDDWNGADFLAQHLSGETVKIQLKGRLTLCRKYQGKDLWVAFPHSGGWYLYPHDEVLTHASQLTRFASSQSWLSEASGEYSWPSIPKTLKLALEPYYLQGTVSAG